ncbi:hypothetical protein MINTM011_29700 [Mycobacterium paraintracellulare]|nr:hypothetical protein MINTM011_29700 [Mycobacterium paraintracellulare]
MNEQEKVGAVCGLTLLSSQWISASTSARYSYHFAALGGPAGYCGDDCRSPAGSVPIRIVPGGTVTTRKPSFWKYLENRVEFEIDDSLDNKLLMSVAPRGFLRRKM